MSAAATGWLGSRRQSRTRPLLLALTLQVLVAALLLRPDGALAATGRANWPQAVTIQTPTSQPHQQQDTYQQHQQQHPPQQAQALPVRPHGLHNPLHAFNTAAAVWQAPAAGRGRGGPSPEVRVSPDVLDSSGTWVTVAWNGLEQPDFDDFVAVYVPAGADIAKTSPAKFTFCAGADAGHLVNGSGTLRFRLINYRQDIGIVLVRGGLVSPVAVAEATIRVQNPNEPLQAHLALTADPSEMMVQWTSHNASSPLVRWGASPGRLDLEARAESDAYSDKDMCGGTATSNGWVHSGTQHWAVLRGLERGRRYYYSFGDAAWGFSAPASFVAAPNHGDMVHVLLTADVGQGEADGANVVALNTQQMASLNTTRLLAADAPGYSLLIHNGDISYAEGFSTQWDNFFTQIEPVAARMPYMAVPGNHERDWPGTGGRWDVEDSGGECGVAFERRVRMPLPGPDKWWYAFDWGPVHFLQYSTEHAFEPGSEQYDFIEHDLQTIDRAKTPWVVVGGHRPIYISSTAAEGPDCDQVVSAALRAALEPLLLRYNVDLTLHGHHHTYQRTCPVGGGVCLGHDENGAARGPVHLVIGHGGAGLSMNMQHPPPSFLRVSQLWWGYARMHASPTELHIEVVSDADGSLMDEFKLVRPRH
uniref:Purple acid phosphatase n=1 Tax=Chlamydomonas euryale TaxID=1486919 RepID=A0A7R9UZ11_9CHLO|mmetsp:Transcript_10007/g.30194  ORF Transcript_10007/g.30194 Transcript_10007/m.30194 type:complete len:645 (+) Transcript_10007:135-2069(+)